MRHVALILFAAAAIAAAGSGKPAHAQGKTYPSYYGSTPSASFYPMRNWYDQDTYMNPNPFPEYPARTYEERAYSTSYPPNAFPAPGPSPYGFHRYYAASPTQGYYYEGPFVYGHYDRSGRMAFRYGWW
jgi:hypothetical protein